MAEPRSVATTSATTTPADESDWTDQVTDLIVDVVDRVHDSTTGKVITAARWLVFGVAALFIVVPILILGMILLGRLLDRLPGPVWIADAVLGGVLFLVGTILWSKREAVAA
jgi:hypothetical protein